MSRQKPTPAKKRKFPLDSMHLPHRLLPWPILRYSVNFTSPLTARSFRAKLPRTRHTRRLEAGHRREIDRSIGLPQRGQFMSRGNMFVIADAELTGAGVRICSKAADMSQYFFNHCGSCLKKQSTHCMCTRS